jgi:hypothetical protein
MIQVLHGALDEEECNGNADNSSQVYIVSLYFPPAKLRYQLLFSMYELKLVVIITTVVQLIDA